MKREEILAMKPGEHLDRVVALRVMGYEESKTMKGWVRMGALATYPKRYSTDISVAWELVHKLKIAIIPQSPSAPTELSYYSEYENEPYVKKIHVFAETAPEAICKAALLAVLEDINLPGEETE